MTSLEKICAEIRETAIEAGEYIKKESQNLPTLKIEEKDRNSLVTKVDKTAEQMIVGRLLKLIPDAGLLTEEDTEDISGRDYCWVIDPLDGTTNFLQGIPCYCVSIALTHNLQPVAGVVYEVNHNECFYAWKDGGAFMNGLKIKASSKTSMLQAFIGTGFPYTDFTKVQAYMDVMRHFMENTRGVRRLGAAAVDLAYVACGRFDGFFEYGLNPWDVAAGVLIIQEAGGRVTDFSGGNDYLYGGQIVGSNSILHELILQEIQTRF